MYVDSVQFQLQKQYTVELRNPGVSSVKVRQDSRIMASGGWDGRSVQLGIIWRCSCCGNSDNMRSYMLGEALCSRKSEREKFVLVLLLKFDGWYLFILVPSVFC